MTTRCDSCRNKIRGRAHTSLTGRVLCSRCRARSRGRTAGVLVDGTRAEDAAPRRTGSWTARVKRVLGRG